jgi:hypothetical protein
MPARDQGHTGPRQTYTYCEREDQYGEQGGGNLRPRLERERPGGGRSNIDYRLVPSRRSKIPLAKTRATVVQDEQFLLSNCEGVSVKRAARLRGNGEGHSTVHRAGFELEGIKFCLFARQSG